MSSFWIGIVFGMIAGLLFYRFLLDKPETEYNGDVKIKQKRGIFKNFLKRN